MAPPLISVVMPVRDGARFVDQAIASIRSQTFADFEFIIVDDGSADATPQLLARQAAADPRIRLLAPVGRGLVPALNQAIAAASGRLIARMDADDVALPQRFARQAGVLAARPSVAVVGSFVQVIDAGGRQRQIRRWPCAPAAVGAALMEANCIAHPTVLMRRDAVLAVGGYRAAFRHGEDYDLWLRLAERHDLLNLDEVLLHYRDHAGQATWRDIEQRILTELGAQAAARHRRAGRPDPAAGLDCVTREFLRKAGVAEATLEAALIGHGLGAAQDAVQAGQRRAARAALALVRRQPSLRFRTRLHCWLMRARSHLP
jgi:hypothetical protein